MKTIGEISEQICQELPERWELVVCIKGGSVQVRLYDPLGERCASPYLLSQDLGEWVRKCLEYAKQHDAYFL